MWTRLAGYTTLGTMKKVVNEGWDSSEYAIVATDKGYWDALSATGLAGVLDCPILMTDPSSLSPQTISLLVSKSVKKVVVVGGTSAVSGYVVSQIEALGATVDRVAGNTAVGTANAIYKYGVTHGGWGDTGDAVVATSAGFQDALSIAPYAYAKKAPIFLAAGKDGTLSSSTLYTLEADDFTRTLIVGGTAVVNASEEDKVPNAKRLAGNTAYGTSRVVADFCLASGMTVEHMGVARGDAYQDALAGAALLGKQNSIIILADDNNKKSEIKEAAIKAAVDPNRDKLKANCYVFGGTSAISVPVWNRLVGDEPTKSDIDFTGVSLNLPAGGYVYDGQAKTPALVGMPAGLVAGSDYTVSYADNTDAGTATVTVEGLGAYADSKKVFQFEIAQAQLASVTLDATSLVYSGSEQRKAVASVTAADGSAVPADGYTVAGDKATDVKTDGDYTLTVTGTGNYTGSATATWNITPADADLSKLSIALDPASCTYDGTAHEPAATVTYDGTTLSASDYTVSYTDNKDAGTATATITLQGNYKAVSKDATFTIDPYALSKDNAQLSFANDGAAYTGSAIDAGAPTLTLTTPIGPAGSLITTVPASDFTVSGETSATNVGIYNAQAACSGNYTGTVPGSWSIVPGDPSKIEVTLAQTTYIYDGTAHEPAVTVSYEGTTVDAADYTVSYTDNKDAGQAKATVTFQGNYKAVSKDATFTISPYTLKDDNAQLSFANDGTAYNASAIQAGAATLTLKTALADGTTTLSASDYDLSGDTSGTNAATYTAKASGKGNFTGSTSGTWKIVPGALSAEQRAAVQLDGTTLVYDGQAKKPAVTGLPTGLSEGVDYTVAYANNTDATAKSGAKATATLSFKGNWGASADLVLEFEIEQAQLASVTLDATPLVYSGSEQRKGVASVAAATGARCLRTATRSQATRRPT